MPGLWIPHPWIEGLWWQTWTSLRNHHACESATFGLDHQEHELYLGFHFFWRPSAWRGLWEQWPTRTSWRCVAKSMIPLPQRNPILGSLRHLTHRSRSVTFTCRSDSTRGCSGLCHPSLLPEESRGSTGFTAFSDCYTHKLSHHTLTVSELTFRSRDIECIFFLYILLGCITRAIGNLWPWPSFFVSKLKWTLMWVWFPECRSFCTRAELVIQEPRRWLQSFSSYLSKHIHFHNCACIHWCLLRVGEEKHTNI